MKTFWLTLRRTNRRAHQRNASDQLKAGGVEAAAKAFEAMFIKMLLDAMPESEDSAISGSFGGGVWRDMLHPATHRKPRNKGQIEAIVRQIASSSGHPTSPYRRWRAGQRAPLARAPDHRSTPPPLASTTAPTAPRFAPSWTPRNARPQRGYGQLVESSPDGTTTRYAHLDRIDVTLGQRLERGELLGTVGSTGQSTGPHLHFEVRQNGQPIDPEPYLKAQASQPVARRGR